MRCQVHAIIEKNPYAKIGLGITIIIKIPKLQKLMIHSLVSIIWFNFRSKAIFVSEDNEDSIDAFNIQLTKEHDWVITQSLPKGSILVDGELEKRLA